MSYIRYFTYYYYYYFQKTGCEHEFILILHSPINISSPQAVLKTILARLIVLLPEMGARFAHLFACLLPLTARCPNINV